MGIQVMEASRQRRLSEQLAAVHQLPDGEAEAIQKLASQLHRKRLLPVVGAGASWDCGIRVGSEIATELFEAYQGSSDFAPYDDGLDETDLPGIAQAIYVRKGQLRVVQELGLPDPEMWRPAEAMGDHFCVYCVLARMVRERLLDMAFSFNYDCGAEAGLKAEGFGYGNGQLAGGAHWLDRARIIADAGADVDPNFDKSTFTLYKANGCAVRYRELAELDQAKAAEEIVIRRDQLDKWPTESWSRERFRIGVRDHIVMLVGFAAQDAKFTGELNEVLKQVYAAVQAKGMPRVIAIDRERAAASIEGVIQSGLGNVHPPKGVVTQIGTNGSTATAALLLLLVELLAIELAEELEAADVVLPTALDARLATFAVSTPTMLRWAYLAQAPGEKELIQRANQVACGGYVPHNYNQRLSVRLIETRSRVRERLGRMHTESSAEAQADHGFVVDGAFAYMPVGIPIEDLRQTCREGPELEALRTALLGHYPANLECVLLAGDGSKLEGINLATGRQVDNG